MGEDDEERALEQQLELQLEEQRDSLKDLNDALALDSTNMELLTVYEEIVLAIRDAEEGLLHLKRSRLLREADSMLTAQDNKAEGEDVKVEPHDSNLVEVEPMDAKSYTLGSKCRFRHRDGRWYDGHIVGLDGSTSARVSFLTPTSENMLICKFFLQERCRFGSNCRLSHGVNVPVSSLKKYIPTMWQQSLAGSSIWAASNPNNGVWRKAELESWDEELGLGQVVFQDDGSSTKLGRRELSLSEFAQMSEEEETYLSSETSCSSDSEEDGSEGIGFMEATNLQRGIQTDTAVFAKWENHTRGMASKMMASMGYREGMGLGASGQGIVDPVSVKVLPPKQSLDRAFESKDKNEKNENSEKKRSRGGKRKREKKFAAAARATKDAAELEPNVFTFINHQLAAQDGSGGKQQSKGAGEVKEDRRSIVAYGEEVKDLKIQVDKLEEMVSRNRKEKAVHEAFLRKLTETRKALADAETAHASASNAVVSKEKEKRWLKF
ncbi:hypothetical protein GIB67_014014 [Kingdonia uniflora]|uniref:Zinc finger CCCH domain-containing protein 18 n=1 Tax=Kingdonia uniflora TaxID=39325 RepID=A0A7J7L5H1_9MAGN|nr:hypothetical protein GIB67_014014 [Kingdonia uniflora]